jgi:hypothetical protein
MESTGGADRIDLRSATEPATGGVAQIKSTDVAEVPNSKTLTSGGVILSRSGMEGAVEPLNSGVVRFEPFLGKSVRARQERYAAKRGAPGFRMLRVSVTRQTAIRSAIRMFALDAKHSSFSLHNKGKAMENS